jgi:NCS1 family nucleobase:cation symporter-1
VNVSSVIALIVGMAVPVTGRFIPGWGWLWDNALIVGMLVAMIVYTWLMRGHETLVSAEEYRRLTKTES